MSTQPEIGEIDKEWNDRVSKVTEAFDLALDGENRGLRNAQTVLAATAFRSGQSTAKGPCANVPFRPQDVEPLLEQAIAILDRATADLETTQLLGEKYATLHCDLEQFIKLDQILEEEEANLKYKVEGDVADSQVKANAARIVNVKEALSQRQNLYQAVYSATPYGNVIAERVGAIGYVRTQYNPDRNYVAGPPYFPEPMRPGDCPDRKIDIERRLTIDQYKWESTNEAFRTAAAVADSKAELDAATASVDGLVAQRTWSQKNASYQQRRADVIRQVMQRKVAMTEPGGLLDFLSRMSAIASRYQEQFADAYRRLVAVNEGLLALYKYAPDGLADPLPSREDTIESFERILAWTRRVAAWLAAFTRRSHNYVRPISVKRVCGGPKKLDDGKKAGQWTFTIDNSFFSDNERHIRIRGISGWSVGKSGPYMLELIPPTNTWNRFETDKAPFPHVPSDDKRFPQDVKPCRLGRVLTRETGSPPEISGLTALYNASPFGEWTIRVSDPVTEGIVWPDDFQLDLYLAVLVV